MSTVRERILDAISTALAAIATVHTVYLDPIDDPQVFAPALAAGKHVLEIVVDDDRDANPTPNLERFTFGVTIIAHLSVPDGQSPRSVGHALCAAVYGAYVGAAQQWGGLAEQTRCTMFASAVLIDPQYQTTIIRHEFDVRYRFPYGDPATAA